MSYYLHEVPGRLRIKIPRLKKDQAGARELQWMLEDVIGVTSASVSPVTGSVLVTFDPRALSSRAILDMLSHEGYIDLSMALSRKRHFDTAATKAGQALSKAVLGLALDRAFQGSPLSILTALI